MEPPCCDKLSMKRGLWSEEEDAKMLEYLSKHGTGKWTSVPKKAGLRRCGKSCRLRWTNYLRPDLKHENFTSKEEELIIKLHAAIGSRWSMIAQQLPGRTDNDVKNHWNTKLKKKLTNMGIDPVTHKPFSKIFADYGSIGGFPKPGMRIGSLNKDYLKNAMAMKKPNTCPKISNTLAMPMPTKTEPNQDKLLSHHNMIPKNQPSLDLLAQLQAINLVKEASSAPNLRIEKGTFSSSLSPSSSSSTCSSAAQDFPPNINIPFNWNEFLLEDEFLPNEDCQEKEAQVIIESEETSEKVEGSNCKDKVSGHMVSSNIEANETSFVEALIAKESEMLMEFPDLLGGEFY